MINVRDEANFLNPSDRSNLQNMAGNWPFEVHLLVSTQYSKNHLSEVVGKWVDGPNVVSVGFDPVHRYAQIHFGTGTGVPESVWHYVFEAGRSSFHDNRWVDGVNDMINAAATARVQTSQTTSQTIQTHKPQDSNPINYGDWVFWGLVISVIAVATYFVVRMNRRNDATFSKSDDIHPQSPSPPSRSHIPRSSRSTYSSSPAPIIVNNNNDGGFITGMVVGEMISQPTERVVVERIETQTYDPPTPDSSPSVFDGGGSGGDFDSDSDSDSGGSFDSGGGGGDI
jgi:uncharacterized membrane protein YgcG